MAITDSVYSRQKTVYGGSFASDLASLTIAGNGSTPNGIPLGIVQNVQVSFAQQIARIYDVSNGGLSSSAGAGVGGKVPVFYVGGRTQCQATIARVLGPQSGALCAFYKGMGNVCSPQDLNFVMRGGCEATSAGQGTTATAVQPINNAVGVREANEAKYAITGAVMTNIGFTVGSQDMIVNENVTLMFANMECTT